MTAADATATVRRRRRPGPALHWLHLRRARALSAPSTPSTRRGRDRDHLLAPASEVVDGPRAAVRRHRPAPVPAEGLGADRATRPGAETLRPRRSSRRWATRWRCSSRSRPSSRRTARRASPSWSGCSPTSRGTGALSILDVKRGDIGSTMEAYADAYLADGVAAGGGRDHPVALPRLRLARARLRAGPPLRARRLRAGPHVQPRGRAGAAGAEPATRPSCSRSSTPPPR